jgi:hypothetical protein
MVYMVFFRFPCLFVQKLQFTLKEECTGKKEES